MVKSLSLLGKVRFVGYSRGHGKTVVVRHANDVETVYAHLSAYTVKTNDVIKEGQIIGFGGNTGNSRGSHLHLEVRYELAIASQKNEPKYHKVKRGDTLSKLSRNYSLRISEICSLNSISKRSILRIGQIIQIR